MASLQDIGTYADQLLETATTPDYPHALNGIQFENRQTIRGISAAVDFSTRAIEGTIANAANLLVVHHGMFWNGLEQIVGSVYSRLRLLIEHDIAVYASHLPLDRHPALGNNVLLAKELQLEPTGSFARHEGISIGVSGEADIETAELVHRAQKFSRAHGGDTRATTVQKGRRTRKWAICTGAGASADTLQEAVSSGIDTLIVGEGAHWTAVFAEEHDLTIAYAGHYATETLGVRALAEHLGKKFNVPSSFVAAPTGL